MKITNVLLGLAPWILFSVIAERLGPGAVGAAALAAFLSSLALTLRSLRRGGGVSLVDIAAVVTFSILTVVAFRSGHHVQQLLVDYGRGGSALVLAGVMALSAATVPFTEQIAREHVDRAEGPSSAFRAVNRRISLMWAGLIFVMALGHLASGYLAQLGQDPRNILLNWAVPITLVIYGKAQTGRIAGERKSRPSPTRSPA